MDDQTYQKLEKESQIISRFLYIAKNVMNETILIYLDLHVNFPQICSYSDRLVGRRLPYSGDGKGLADEVCRKFT